MKKTYIHPNLQIVHIDVETIIAGGPSQPTNRTPSQFQDEIGGDTQYARPKVYDDSEDDWDY